MLVPIDLWTFPAATQLQGHEINPGEKWAHLVPKKNSAGDPWEFAGFFQRSREDADLTRELEAHIAHDLCAIEIVFGFVLCAVAAKNADQILRER